MSFLPEVGRWVQYTWNHGDGRVDKCKITGYEDVESYGWDLMNGAYNEIERHLNVMYEGGDKDSLGPSMWKNLNWSYIEAPSSDELNTAIKKRNNEMLGYSCNACQETSKKLLMCQGCKKVRYCDEDCQRQDWSTHKVDCVKKKTVLQPNPRYPLGDIDIELGKSQQAVQRKANLKIRDALKGKFTVEINNSWVRNPKATDLQAGERYALKYDSNQDDIIHFKQRALESPEHTNGEPSSCGLYMTLELCYEDKKYKDGRLHNLALDCMDPGIFWGMALNFKTFGTVAPFHPNCHCEFPKMPQNYKKIQKSWDKVFKRARAEITDVQCMFSDTSSGCHSFNLSGSDKCKFKHDIEVEVPKH